MCHQLHVVFFPFLAHGHMIPISDMAKLFASRGVKATILTTALNASVFTKTVEQSCNQIHLHLLQFPAAESGLPQGFENVDRLFSNPDLLTNFLVAISMLQQPLERALGELRPDCLVADMMFPWATNVAAKFDIPRLVFHGTSLFALCASVSMKDYKPFKNVISDSEQFVLPNFPHEIRLFRTQVNEYERDESPTNMFGQLLNQARDSELASYGVIVNSFYELEPDYARHYSEVLKRKAWHIGPVSSCNKGVLERGKKFAIDEHQCLKWLNSKKPNSVIYVCFGSISISTAAQLHEIAIGLQASGQQFIWVVRKPENEEDEKWLPEGLEEKMKDKGLVIRGWAPQVLILEHEAVGGFVTHCGWNSTLEGVSAGVAMVTWPMLAEQFFNEKFVTEILRTGVSVGVRQWGLSACDGVKSEVVETAVRRVMVGEEAEEMRKRAVELKEMARKAVEEGGSSYSDLNALIQELSSRHS